MWLRRVSRLSINQWFDPWLLPSKYQSVIGQDPEFTPDATVVCEHASECLDWNVLSLDTALYECVFEWVNEWLV